MRSACPRRPWRVCWKCRPASRTCRRPASPEHSSEQYRYRRSQIRQSRKSPPHRAHRRRRRSAKSKRRHAPLWTLRLDRANQAVGWLDPVSVDPLDGPECHLRAVVFLAPFTPSYPVRPGSYQGRRASGRRASDGRPGWTIQLRALLPSALPLSPPVLRLDPGDRRSVATTRAPSRLPWPRARAS
jgi:hypothetical protein